MVRATAIFLLLVCALSAGAVFAQSVTPVRAIRSQTVLVAEDLVQAEAAVPGGVASIEDAVGPGGQGRALSRAADPRAASSARRRWWSATRWCACPTRSGPLRIVTDGRALDRAAAGESVRVMNLDLEADGDGRGGGGREHRGRAMKQQLLLLAAASWLAACGMQTIGQPPEMTSIGRAEENAPPILTAERVAMAVPPPQAARYAYQQASLWNTGPSGLLGDRRAKSLGDILTDHDRDRRRGGDEELDRRAPARAARARRSAASSASATCCRRG